MEAQLIRLMREHTDVRKDGFSIRINMETALWDECIRKLGTEHSYKMMARMCNQLYRERFHEDFLFSDECMAYEIAYHTDAFMDVVGCEGYHRDLTTHLFSDEQIIEHCKEIDISTLDVHNFKQATMFHYRDGIRECYKATAKNPYKED